MVRETNCTHNTPPSTARVKLWGHLVTLDLQRLSENQNSFPSRGANTTVHLCKHQETRLDLIFFYVGRIKFTNLEQFRPGDNLILFVL